MRSLPPEDSRTTSDSEPLHDENSSSTQHGLQENDIQALSGFPSQGISDTPNPVLPRLEDTPPSIGGTAFAPENDERDQPNLRQSSQLTTGIVTERELATKVVSDGPQFDAVRRVGKSDGSPIATLPNGTYMPSLHNDI